MEPIPFYETRLFVLVVVPLLIFLARTADVSIGTIRVLFVYRGNKFVAFGLGFIEMLIWLSAIGYVMQNLSKPINIIAFALGFGFGNVVGIYLEDKLAVGKLLIRIFATQDTTALVEKIKSKEYGVTFVEAHGVSGPVKILYSIIDRKDFPSIAREIKEYNPNVFYTVEDIRVAKKGIFPLGRTGGAFLPFIRYSRRKR